MRSSPEKSRGAARYIHDAEINETASVAFNQNSRDKTRYGIDREKIGVRALKMMKWCVCVFVYIREKNSELISELTEMRICGKKAAALVCLWEAQDVVGGDFDFF